MSESKRRAKKAVKILVGLVVVFGLTLGAIAGCVAYLDWSAERRARAFCEAIPIGSDISSAITRAKDEKVLWGSDRFYTFYFPAAFFDKAVCELEVDHAGRVVKKGSVMEHD